MSIFSILLIAIGLSMDAFAVSICKGLKMRHIDYGQTLIIGLFFGGFQALMPLIGWLFAFKFQNHIENFDHWVAFLLLGFIGGKMIYESLHPDDEEISVQFSLYELFILAIATSIDALAVGIVFALSGDVNVFYAVSVIGFTTFILSVIGVFIGHKFGVVYKTKAEFAGGVILVIIGLKILLEHLGVIGNIL